MSVLTEAETIINGDREKTYGSPDKNLNTIAEYWSTHINAKYKVNIKLTYADICGMMVLMKQARLGNTPDHHDSMVDIAGYIALQEKCDLVNNIPPWSNDKSADDYKKTTQSAETGTAIPHLGEWLACTISEFHKWNNAPPGSYFRVGRSTYIKDLD